MSQDIDMVQQEAANHHLGPLVSVHKGQKGRITLQMFKVLVALLIAGGIGALAYFLGFTRALIIEGLLGVIILLAFGYSIYLLIHSLTTSAYLFEQGIIVKKSSRLLVFPWNSIAQVWQDIHRSTNTKSAPADSCTIERNDKLKVILDSALEGIPNLSEVVFHETTQQKFPQALADLESGKTLSFGFIHLQPEGVKKGMKELLAWHDIKDIEIVDKVISGTKEENTFTHALVIGKQDGTTWLSLKTSFIPNYLLLMKLIKSRLTETIQG